MKETNRQMSFILVVIILVGVIMLRNDYNTVTAEVIESNVELDLVETISLREPIETEVPEVIQEKSEEVPIEPIQEIPEFVPYIECSLDRVLQYHIYNLCEKYGVDFGLIMAIIKVESNFDATVTSYNGSSIGLMQINYCNHPFLRDNYGLDNLWDECQNVEGGIIILQYFLNAYNGNLNYALIGYNQGSVPEGVTETTYSKCVMEAKASYDIEILEHEQEYYARFE